MTPAALLPALISLTAFFAQTASAAAPQAEPAKHPSRTWTSVNGNTLEGAFVKEENGKIYLQRPDGTLAATGREKLSPLDLDWIDRATAAPSNTAQTLSFPLATQLEKNKMEEHRKVKRLFISSYARLTNNDREDKSLAFLLRDALKIYGWANVTADCYPTPSGRKGKVKAMSFTPQRPVELREAVQMARDKFALALPDPAVVRQAVADGETFWEIKNTPDYVSGVRLLVEAESQKIRRFDLTFPPPEN